MNENNPIISIIVPAYDIEPYIGKCLDSILAQNYKSFELIIVDDGSTDRTYDVCKKFALKDKRIKLFSQENSGVVVARRTGLMEACGEYVTFVDGDDWIDPDYLMLMVAQIGTADMLSTGMIWEEKKGVITKKRDSFIPGIYNGKRLEELKSKMLFDLEDGVSQKLTAWMFTKLFKLDRFIECYEKVDESVYFYEDALVVYRYVLGCSEIVISDDHLYHYRFRSDSASHRQDVLALSNINKVYIGLVDIAEKAKKSYGLLEQAEQWLFEKSYFTLNERMGLKNDGRIIRYVLNQAGIFEKKIALYGAGRVGQDIYHQLKAMNRQPLLWVDKRSKEIRDERISEISELIDSEFEIVLIAIENLKVIKEITEELMKMGLPKEKIIVAKVYRLF